MYKQPILFDTMPQLRLNMPQQVFTAICIAGGCIGPKAVHWAGGRNIANIDYGENPERIYIQQPEAGIYLRRDIRRLYWKELNKELQSRGEQPIKFGELDVAIVSTSCKYITELNPYSSPYHPDARTILDGTRLAMSMGAKVVIIENVPGLLNKKMRPLMQELERLIVSSGIYCFEVKVLNSSDYGVPQDRQRCMIMLVRKDIGVPFFHAPVTLDKTTMLLSNLIPDIIAFTPGIKKERHCDSDGNLLWTDYKWGSPERIVNTITTAGSERMLLKGNIVRKFTIPELQMFSTAQYHNFDGISEGIIREALGNAIMPGFLYWLIKGVREEILNLDPVTPPDSFWYPIHNI